MFAHKAGMHDPLTSKNSIGKHLKILIFKIYSQLYHQKSLEEKSIFKLKVKEILWGITWCLQILSLLWTPNLSIANWDENMMIWRIIGFLRIDNICSEFGIINGCLYLWIAITFLLGAGIICLAISIRLSLSITKLCGIFRCVFNIWLIFFLIPSITLYSIFLKYAFWPQKYILEYKNNNNLEDFEISAILQFVIILALVIDFPLLYFYTQFSSEIRHSESSKTIKAKAHSKIDGHIAICSYFCPILYVLLDENYMIYFQVFVITISTILIIESEILIPYFSLYCNLAQILKLFAVAITSFGFILGYLIDNSLVIIFIVTIIGPISAIFLVKLIIEFQRQINSVVLTNIEEISSEYKLEKMLRYWLCLNDTEHKNEIIRIFENYFIKNTSHKNKLQIIWIANYCLFNLKDESLAKVKLAKAKSISMWNLEADFQEYLCNKNINESPLSESLQFLSYYQQLNLIKNKDSKLCFYLLKFWEELTSSKPNLKKLKNRLKWIDETISYLNNQYKMVIWKFLDSRECLTLYASYTKDVIYDYEKSNLLQAKLIRLNNQNAANAQFKKISFLNESNCILIISGETDNFGQILFANSRAAEIMKSSIGSLEESDIMSFIHAYYRENLKIEMQWLIHYGSISEIDLGKGFFLNIPGKFLIECIGKAEITSIENNLVFILNFQIKKSKHQAALLTETGEILCCSEYFSELTARHNENLIGFNAKDLFSEKEMCGSDLIFQLQNQAILVMSHTEFYKLNVYYAKIINDHEEIIRWKNKSNGFSKEEKEIAYNKSLKSEKCDKTFLRTYQTSDEKYISSEVKLSHMNSNEPSDVHENDSSSKLSDAKSQISSKKNVFKMLTISSRSINILHFSIVLSIIAVLITNIIVLFYAFSYINFIKNMDFPMAIAKAESRLQCVAYIAWVLWALRNKNDSYSDPNLLIFWNATPAFVNELRDTYLDIASNLPKWNYCSSKTILADKKLNVWDYEQIKKESLLDMLSQSVQQGEQLIAKFNNSEDFSNEVKFLMMNGNGDGFQYCNNSLYEVMECQKSLMLGFKSEVFLLLILGIGVFGLCFGLTIPFYYSVTKIENNFWNNLRKKTFQNYSEIKQSLLERLRNIHSQPEILISNRNPYETVINFKNYWKYIWRICMYFMVVIAFSLTNITYLYENCTNYLAYRPEVLRELIRTKILINTLAISASDLQYDYIDSVSNVLLNIHNYENSLMIFHESILTLRESIVLLRNPKYLPMLSSNFKKMYYENDRQLHPYNNYWDYGTYAAEEEIINSSYLITHLDVSDSQTYWNWVYNLTIFRINYDKFVDEADAYSQSVIEDQVNIIVQALSVFIIASIAIYFALYFVFFKNEKKYLQKINSMISIMPN